MRKATILFSILGIGCNTQSPVETDYREAFEGEYIGTRSGYTWIMGGTQNSSITEDTVFVTALSDSLLLIDATEIQIPPSGEFYQQGGASASSFYSVRFFSGDSLEVDMNTGGLGGGSRSTFLGKKQH